MEDIWEARKRRIEVEDEIEKPHNLKTRIEKLEDNVKYKQMREETSKTQKDLKIPFRWKRELNKGNGRLGIDNIIIFYLNIKNEIEPPKLVPLYSGNIIIYKNKAHEFDPRAIWTLKIGKKMYKAVLIREIDRRPVSNLDWDEVKKRGDATDSDEILVKMVTKAVIEKNKKQMNRGVIILVVIIIIAAIVFFMFFK